MTPLSIRIGRHSVGAGRPPFIIAEMSGNHNGSLARALKIVDACAKAGAHALKIQTYTADTMTLDVDRPEFRIRDAKSLWKGARLYDLYARASTPWEWHRAIFARCRAKGILGFSTPFDLTAVDFLESLNVPLYKVASLENTDLRLIRYIAKTGKPMIVSTGTATLSEIEALVAAARGAGCKKLILLKCTSAYPAPSADAHLRTMLDMQRRFRCPVGLSDHALGSDTSLAAAALGACAIERHVTLDREDGGVDSAFSLEPAELAALVRSSRTIWESLGDIRYGPTPAEKTSLRFRRSLYIGADMQAGDRMTTTTLRAVRPGFGLPTKYFDALLGRPVTQSVRKGTPVQWELFSAQDAKQIRARTS